MSMKLHCDNCNDIITEENVEQFIELTTIGDGEGVPFDEEQRNFCCIACLVGWIDANMTKLREAAVFGSLGAKGGGPHISAPDIG